MRFKILKYLRHIRQKLLNMSNPEPHGALRIAIIRFFLHYLLIATIIPANPQLKLLNAAKYFNFKVILLIP